MGWWFEAWTLPHTGSLVRKHAAIPVQGWSFDRNIDKTREQLTISVPRAAALLADLITVDPDDHTNDVASLIRVYRSDVVDGSGDPRPVAEFLASRRADQAGDTATDTVDITCKGITSVLDHPIVYPFDYPATPTAQADWLYGAPSDLTNGSFENNDTVAEITEVWTDATGGTFTLSTDGGTTSAIAYNASTTDIDTAVTAALVAAGNTSPQVEVSGAGTEEDPWRIEYVSPHAVVPSTTADGASLTGGGITVTTPTQGRQEPAGWTLATHGVTGELFGTYGPDPLEILTSPAGGPDGGGGLALLVDVDSQFGGIQTVPIAVVGGERRRASAWVRTPDSGQRFVLVVRGAYDERFVARTAEITPTADTWTELAVDGIVPDDLTHLIIRVSYVGTVNPSPFWVDQVTTAAGAPAATVGRIWLDLLADIQTDHAADPRGAFLTWITPTFTDGVDSNGVAWQGSHSVTVPEGATYLQFAEQILDRFGYELSVDWNPATSQHELNVYNPAGLGDTITGHAVVVGGNAIAGETVRSEPSGTAVFVRGANDRWRETKDADVETVWERRERHVRARDVATNGDLDQIADETLTDLLDAMTGLQYQMSDHGQTVPIRDFDAGDTIHVQPGTRAGIPANTRRVTAIKVSGIAGQATGLDVHVTSEVLGSLGLTAQAEAVRRLIRRLGTAQPEVAAAQFFDPRIGGGAGTVPWVVAAADAPQAWKDVAGYQCTGTNDHVTIAAATTAERHILLSPGQFVISQPTGAHAIDMNGFGFGASIRGCGNEATFLTVTGNASTFGVFRLATACHLADFAMFGGTTAVFINGAYAKVSNVLFQGCHDAVVSAVGTTHIQLESCWFRLLTGTGIQLDTAYTAVNACTFDQVDGYAVHLRNTANNVAVTGCAMWNCSQDWLPFSSIYLEDTTRACTVSGCTVMQSDGHGVIVGGTNHTIVGNTIASYETGIRVVSATRCAIQSNVVDGGGISAPYFLEDGIVLVDSSECVVAGNLVCEPGGSYDTGTADGLRIEGNSDRNLIHGNTILPFTSGTNPTRYGVRVAAATCDRNVIHGNWLGEAAAYDVAAYSDAGTGTVTSVDANGQFTW